YDRITAETKLELDAREQGEMAQAQQVAKAATESKVDFSAEFALAYGEEVLDPRLTQENNSAQVQEEFLHREQRALVEVMVRAYARRRLQPLLEEFEVLEVEREGEWLLHETAEFYPSGTKVPHRERWQLWWMSRPDALLRHRITNDLHIMSFKTTGAWDHRKEKDALRDMQGLSEGVEIERRLGEWWDGLKECQEIPLTPVWQYLRTLESRPRIAAIRYEYLLKGERWKDKGLSEKLGLDARSQNTPLLQPYKKIGITAGDDQYGWKYEYQDAGGSNRRLDYRSWKKTYIWEAMSLREWIDMLDRGDVQPDAGDALAAQFVAPMTVYRNEDDLRDWIESTEHQEVEVVKHAELVQISTDADEKRSLLNRYFPMTRTACEYPGTCSFIHLCYGSEDIRRDPVGSGKYVVRVPNHPQEKGN